MPPLAACDWSIDVGCRPVPKLVPPTTMLLSPLLPSRPCHWKPNSAALSPRRPRRSGSRCRPARGASRAGRSSRAPAGTAARAAVMISELVAGSAWMKPPVEGPARGADRRRRLRRDGAGGAGRAGRGWRGCGVVRRSSCRRRRRRRRRAEGRAQHLRELGRVGVLQVHDPDVAAARPSPAAAVELGDQRADAGHAAPGWRRARSASCCACRPGSTARAVPRFGAPGAPAAGAAAVGQALHQRRDVGGDRVAAAGSPRRRRPPACPSRR